MRDQARAVPAHRFTMCVVTLIVLWTPCSPQETDDEEQPANRITARVSSGTVAEVQYSRFVFPSVSGDVDFQMKVAGPSAGVSVYPLTFLFAQARIGIPLYSDAAAPDGPAPFDPDYMVIIRGGILIHIRISPVFLEFAAGRILAIQKDYCPTCGGLLSQGSPTPAQVFVTRQESTDVLSFGVVVGF